MTDTQTASRIVLVRHGKPLGAINPMLNSAGFTQWVRRFDHSRVSAESPPPTHLRAHLGDAFAVSSTLPRALHSTELCLGRAPDARFDSLREMEIPRYRLPGKLPAYGWVYLNRGLWMLGKTGPFETWPEAKDRGRQAAQTLADISRSHPNLAVFGHVMMNAAVARSLIELGWRGRSRHTDYWGSIELLKEATP